MTTQTLPPVAAVTGSNTEAGAELREVFSRSLSRSSGGAQLTVSVRGERVVDLAGGSLTTTTPVQVFSVSKLLVALAAAHAHDRGLLDLDAPLAAYWPAFDRPSTRSITGRMVLDHSCGIPAVATPLTVDDLLAGRLDEEIARQEPYWEPGTDHGYGAFTYGALMAGVFNHAIGQTVQHYVAAHLTGPANARFDFGTTDAVAPLSFTPPVLTEATAAAITEGRAIVDGSFMPILADTPGFFADPRVIAASWPSMSGVSTASDLAQILEHALGYGPGPAALSRQAVEGMIAERTHGWDRINHLVSRFGSGVELPSAANPLLGGRSFGHQGAVGSVAAADPDSGLVVTYVTTHAGATLGVSDQALVLLAAARELKEGLR